MAGQRGRDILLRIATEQGGFTAVAGLRATRITLTAGTVDATAADSPEAWRQLLAGAGPKSARISGRGVFRDAPSDARIRADFFAGRVPIWQLVLPDFGTIEGRFQIAELSWSGDHDAEAAFSITLESAGPLTFTVIT